MMIKEIIYKRVLPVLVETLLVVGLLMPMPVGRAQESDRPDPSRFENLKIQKVRERVQDRSQRADALDVQAAKLANGSRVRVLQREKLGNYIEAIDSIPTGPFANHIVMAAGLDVYGVPASANSDHALHKLFDVRKLDMFSGPRGITYIASEKLFAVVEPAQPEMLFVCDHHGNPLPPRPIQYLGGFSPDHVEGLAYLPNTSAMLP